MMKKKAELEVDKEPLEQTINSQTGSVINTSGSVGGSAGIIARMTRRYGIDRQERNSSARFEDGYTHLRG